MSELLPDQNSDTSMFSSEDFLAKTSAKPESEPDSKALVRAFGLSSPVLLAKFDPDTWLLRTLQESFLCEERWEPLSGSWPDSAMWDATSVYELRTSGRPILESASSSWPTMTAADSDGRTLRMKSSDPFHKAGGMHAMSLDRKVAELDEAIWRTPNTRDHHAGGPRLDAKQRQIGLVDQTANWLTPHGMHGTDHTGKTGRGGEFAKQATGWATPNAHDGRRPGSDATSTQGANLKRDAELWATPCVPNGGRTMSEEDVLNKGTTPKGKRQVGLEMQGRYFPTPASRDWRSEKGGDKTLEHFNRPAGPSLPAFVEHSPQAPAIPDGPTSSESDLTSLRHLSLQNAASAPKRRLNPRFVEFLMGFPIGWTEL